MTVKQASKLKIEDFMMLITGRSIKRINSLRCSVVDVYEYYVEGAKSRIKAAQNRKEKKKILKEEYCTITGFVNFIYREEIYAKGTRVLMIEREIN